jgi:hypothetical protein
MLLGPRIRGPHITIASGHRRHDRLGVRVKGDGEDGLGQGSSVRLYARDMSRSFVPDDYVVPLSLTGPGFRLEPLGPQHNDADHRAWMSSIEHIRATPGFSTGGWPPVEGMAIDENLGDLRRHADDFARRVGFTYTVLDDEDVVVGCVYIYPSRADPDVTEVRSWVTARRAELDSVLHDTVDSWLAADWPFTVVRYRNSV